MLLETRELVAPSLDVRCGRLRLLARLLRAPLGGLGLPLGLAHTPAGLRERLLAPPRLLRLTLRLAPGGRARRGRAESDRLGVLHEPAGEQLVAHTFVG